MVAIAVFVLTPSRLELVACTLVCLACAGISLARSHKRLFGTTLVAPWFWSCLALAVVSLGTVFEEFGGAKFEPQAVAHVRYLSAITTLAPIVALLGAKRPQDRAWQWIVFSLLALLALPSLKAIAFDGGAAPDPHAAWRWLIAIICLAGLFNYLPTRFAPSAILFFVGQLLLLAEYLPGSIWRVVVGWRLLGLILLSAAVVVAYLRSGRRRRSASPEDRLWLDFRDAFGALWALRVAERFNATAAQNGWKLWLSWSGLKTTQADGEASRDNKADALPAELRPAVHQALKSLLWRFLSAEWIADRLGSPVAE